MLAREKQRWVSVFLFLSCINGVFAQSNSTQANGNWLNSGKWTTSPYPSATDCYTPITITHDMGIQNSQDVDLSGCGVVHITIDGSSGGAVRMGDSGGLGATWSLASGSTITLTNGGTIQSVGSGSGANASIVIGGNTIWDGSYGDITGEVVLNESTPLPVELVSFTGQFFEGIAILTWETASELNNSGFEVQFSEDTKTFIPIGWVEGNGTTGTRQTYSFESGLRVGAYFRLKQIDFDGQFEYSPVIHVVNTSVSLSSLRIYPNPVSEGVHLDGDIDGQIEVAFMDASGRLIFNDNFSNLYEVESRLNKCLGSLDNGLYILSLRSQIDVVTEHLLVR